jgi:integrase
VVCSGTDPLTRKARYLRETAGTHRDAEVALTRLLRQVDEDAHPKSALTVGRAIAQWLEVASLGETTRERYDDLIRIYIDPAFADVLAAKLDAERLERFYARLQQCRELCGGRGRAGHTCRPLSGSTVRKIHFVLRGALELAVRWRHLGVNRAALARAPSPSRPEPDPPSAAEAAALLNAAWADPDWGLLLWLTMVTGLRRGEVSALRWSHVDVDRGCLLVQRANAQPKAGVLEKETQTGQQRRVALDQRTIGLLTAHRQLVAARCAALGCDLDDEAWLFSPRAGRLGALPPAFPHPAVPAAGDQAEATLDPAALAAALLGHRTARRGRRPADRGRASRPRQRWGDHAEDLRRVGRRGRPARSRHDGRHHAGTGVVPAPPQSPYEVIAASLRGRLERGELLPGHQLPTVVELAKAHAVAVGTAHRAIALLRNEGLLDVTRGRRAVVMPRRTDTTDESPGRAIP